ncbi:hypothetical protein E4633_06540 [Geomonas terrae]|uniref:Uncharacterized protein n=2 Tax=Geomonas terrae TaxID=2562681 RepID=A0A4S1CP62_9BACT|nr:hypothetical protein E4633_06540 [Geomonas terrae]
MRMVLPRLRHEKTEKGRTEIFDNFTNELSALGMHFIQSKGTIDSNQDLSDKGREKQISELRLKYLPRIADYQRQLSNIREQFVNEANQYRPRPYQGTGNPVLDYLVGKEFRDYLKSLPMSERVRQILDPALDPTGQKLHAVETSPVPDHGITADLIARAHQARMNALNPDGVLALQDQEIVLEALECNLNVVKATLEWTDKKPDESSAE